MKTRNIQTEDRESFIDITGLIEKEVKASGLAEGICHVFVPHTTAAVTINESADPDVKRDILRTMEKIVPWKGDYRHLEGNSAAHIKASLLGASVTVPVRDGKLFLGTWQGIFFCEFDGPRNRKFVVQIVNS